MLATKPLSIFAKFGQNNVGRPAGYRSPSKAGKTDMEDKGRPSRRRAAALSSKANAYGRSQLTTVRGVRISNFDYTYVY